ncbi:putative transcription factor C3H family [Helianthus annuus]|uniref:Transcription factor C3H family n=2 Tax=Helianthus annuus TaxID=4232 RepID=A0A9K3I4Y7_HELAN|nr:zinc finger CCCH domain-containing protein 29 [Helianthus annuus]KAF5790361.1 putative transcription factor C3H family [Helianthus annuus]KAJ0525583.1 putative transcription factor C3H family [Helianthus annuus]KAJ0541966.1 putative transcription factor C3H family [Helianthus annuus]KAJ0711055.1 putative transcription factor C3H family [Helianthus annuus]KAJ0892643.1 putative transcription factor C3H family [Helianthus annuus]
MCKVTKGKFYSAMDEEKLAEKYQGLFLKCSNLLELAAADDVTGFVHMVEDSGVCIDEVSFWYGRRIGDLRKMGLEERTPLMIASTYGSIRVLKFIIGTKRVDVNKFSDSDGATALHCAVAGGSPTSVAVVKLLLEASADVNMTDDNGNKAVDLIARGVKASTRRALERLLKGLSIEDGNDEELIDEKETVAAKKEYPVDVSMPDINNGVYGSDEFRMYTFKVKPCSRAYTHDWTECPFVHPGENARRRDLRKFNYSCVPCPEFRKGSCVKGDSCEYAHGVFESWLHPAQYRTRLCKDETGCARKVCFFAHRVEELRPVYASTGSGLPSPKSGSVHPVAVTSMEMGSMSPLALGSTPQMSPPTSPMWQNKVNHLTPPTLQLPGSRLKTALNARDLEIDMELLGLESIRTQQQHQQRQQMIDDLSNNLYNNNNNRFGELKPRNLDDVFGSLDQSLLSQFHGLSPKVSNTQTQLQSPTSHQQFNSLRASYPSPNYSSSPVRKPVGYGFDSSAAVAQAVMNSRSGSLKQRSHSFIDRGAGAHIGLRSNPQQSSGFTEWGSPDGKLEWGFEDANKLRKSVSFGYGGTTVNVNHEPDVSWVNTMVKDVGTGVNGSPEMARYGGSGEILPQWVEQMYIEQEQMVA